MANRGAIICALSSCRLRVIMNLHTITMMFFLLLSCDARKYARNSILAAGKSLILDEITPNDHDIDMPLDSSPTTYGNGVSPPFLPPYDSLAPIPLPENTPPFCLYPPFTPQTPPSIVISPPPIGRSGGGDGGYITPPVVPSPTLPPIGGSGGGDGGYIAPPVVPSPPTSIYPSPSYNTPPYPQLGPTPATPSYLFPNPPPSSIINVPTTTPPTPMTFVPGSPVFLPPIVYPPPAVPPPPYFAPPMALWCVAKPSVPGPIIEEAMNYACGSGADCDQIQPNGSCFLPDSLVAHASYAFNSYWQRTKVAGGTCEFGGTAILVTMDPSYDGCQFMYF